MQIKSTLIALSFFLLLGVMFLFAPFLAPSLTVKYSPLLSQIMAAGANAPNELEEWTRVHYRTHESEILNYAKSRNSKERKGAVRCILYATRDSINSYIDKSSFFGAHTGEEDEETLVDIVYIYGSYSGDDVMKFLISCVIMPKSVKVKHTALGSLMSFASNEEVQSMARDLLIKTSDKVEIHYFTKIIEAGALR